MELNSVLRRNIEVLQEQRRREEASATLQDQLARAISGFAGSIKFVFLHLVLLVLWITINVGAIASVPPFDPSFVILATAASVEAIFLSTFILISQNRAAVIAAKRSDLDVQMSLLTEHEVTRVLTLCSAIAEHLNVSAGLGDPELRELKQDVAPERVLEEIEVVAGNRTGPGD